MKTFTSLKAFEKRLQKGIVWEDYFKLDGRTWNIYEYGGGAMFHMDYDYVYFLNKNRKTNQNDVIYIRYDCPSYQYKDGVKVETKKYRFIDLELIENASLWR